MPTYSYECSGCLHKFDRFQSITEKPVKQCPSCGRRKVRRLIGAGAGFIFKGSGFYQTDYRSENYKSGAKADSETPKTDKPSTDTKTDKGSSTPKKE